MASGWRASSIAVSREHRRAKTDRLDTELLKRAFLGWLRGERNHCKMVAIPTISDEDAKRPHRERESLIGEQSRIVNRMKATLIRLGIRGFNPKLIPLPDQNDFEAEIPAPQTSPDSHPVLRRKKKLGGVLDVEGFVPRIHVPYHAVDAVLYRGMFVCDDLLADRGVG